MRRERTHGFASRPFGRFALRSTRYLLLDYTLPRRRRYVKFQENGGRERAPAHAAEEKENVRQREDGSGQKNRPLPAATALQNLTVFDTD